MISTNLEDDYPGIKQLVIDEDCTWSEAKEIMDKRKKHNTLLKFIDDNKVRQ